MSVGTTGQRHWFINYSVSFMKYCFHFTLYETTPQNTMESSWFTYKAKRWLYFIFKIACFNEIDSIGVRNKVLFLEPPKLYEYRVQYMSLARTSSIYCSIEFYLRNNNCYSQKFSSYESYIGICLFFSPLFVSLEFYIVKNIHREASIVRSRLE